MNTQSATVKIMYIKLHRVNKRKCESHCYIYCKDIVKKIPKWFCFENSAHITKMVLLCTGNDYDCIT
jgi:hypothetical protein